MPGPSQRARRIRLPASLLVLLVLLASCGPTDPLEEIRALHAAGSFEASLEPLRSLLDERPDDPEVHFLYGTALLGVGRPSLAVWSFRKAMETPEWRVAAGVRLAAGELQIGNTDAAIEAAGRVLEASPDNPDALLLRAWARVQSRRDYEGALADADRALELDPENADALVPRVVALLGLERAEEAAVAIDELERRFQEESLGPESRARYCAARASFSKEDGDLEEADRRYGECLEEFPTRIVLVDSAIGFYDEQGRPERVLEILRAAVQADPRVRWYRILLAKRLQNAGEVDEAEKVLLAATELEEPGLAYGAWVDLAAYYTQEREDYAAGISAYERALALVPGGNPDLLFGYAETLALAGRFEEALRVARGMEVRAHRDLVEGRVLLLQGRPAEALERLTAGLRLWPDNAVARYYAALAAERLGDFERAISEYRYSVRIDAGATDARLRLARLHEAEGADDLALSVLHHNRMNMPGDVEMARLELEILARQGRATPLPPHLARLVRPPDVWGGAVAALADGVRARSGPAAAAQFVQHVDAMDLTDPRNAEALRGLVVDLGDAGEADRAVPIAEASLRARPETAAFHEILALALARAGAAEDRVRAVYERAVELDPQSARALAGLAGLSARVGDTETALSLYARAVEAEPEAAEPRRALAELLVSLDRPDDAERTLEELLVERPYDRDTAARLAELRLRRGADGERTLELARRAVRFGGGPEADRLLERVQRSGDPAPGTSPHS